MQIISAENLGKIRKQDEHKNMQIRANKTDPIHLWFKYSMQCSSNVSATSKCVFGVLHEKYLRVWTLNRQKSNAE